MNGLFSVLLTVVALFIPYEGLENDVEALNYVKDAEIIVFDSYCLIAIKSDAIYSISELNLLYKDIEELAVNKYNYPNVIVTRDNDLFYEVNKLNNTNNTDEASMKKVIDKAVKRYNKRLEYN